MKNLLKILLLFLILCLLSGGCSEKIRNTDKADVKKVETLRIKDQTQTITTKKADSLFKIAGSQLEKSFFLRPWDPGLEADSLEEMESENADLKFKTTVNKKTGKVTTQATAKDKEVKLSVEEKIVENKDVSVDFKGKSDSSSKKTEAKKTPSPSISRFAELFETVCVILLVVAGLYLGLRYLIRRSSKNTV